MPKAYARPRKPRIEVPSPYCVIGKKLSLARSTGQRTFFADPLRACSHAANLLESDLRSRQDHFGPDERELYVVKIVKVIRPKQPSLQYDFFDVEA